MCDAPSVDAGDPNVQGDGPRSVTGGRTKPVDVIVLTVLASATSILRLGDKSLTGDEATSFFIASRSFEDFWLSLTTSEANGSLFYALLRIPVAFGSDPFLLRLIPALCAIVTVPILYLLLARLFGRWTGVVGAAALAFNAFFITHAQNARGYSMATMFATLATFLFVLAVEQPTRARRTLYVAAAVAGCYSHIFCIFGVVAHVSSLIVLPSGARPRRWFVLPFLAVAVLVAPLAYLLLTGDRGQVDWIPETSVQSVTSNVYAFTGHGGAWLAAVVGICVALAVFRWIESLIRVGRSEQSWRATLVVVWLLVPIALTLAMALLKPLFVGRYLLPALPGLAGAVALGLGALRWRVAFAAVSAVLLILFASQLPDAYSAPRPGWAMRADLVVENAAPGDGVVLYAPTSIRPFGYYAGYYTERDDGAVAPDPVYPAIDWLGYSRTRYEPDVDAILAAASTYDRVWVVLGNAEDDERRAERDRLLGAFEERCDRVSGFEGTVRLYADCDAAVTAL